MFQFVMLVWNRDSEEQAAYANRLSTRLRLSSRGWNRVLQADEALVFCIPDPRSSTRTYELPAGRGVIFGRLFRNRSSTGARLPISFDECEADRIDLSRGRHLIEEYWGRYVAFLRLPDARTTLVVRDPTGNVPCCRLIDGGVNVLFSHPSSLLELGMPAPSVNWEYMATHVAFQGIHIGLTGLEGIEELHAGSSIEFSRGTSSTHQLWDPLAISSDNVLEDPNKAAEQLRQVTEYCVHTWAHCFSGIVHTLSGGIDSSIVLACLRTCSSPPNVACVNYATASADGDEREFARAVAGALNYELIEEVRNPASIRLDQMCSIVPDIRPWNYRYYVDVGPIETEIARRHGADAIFGGGGGDQVFFKGNVHLALRDFLRTHSLSLRTWAVAWDVARVDGKSIWSVLRTNVPAALSRRPWDVFNDLGTYTALVPQSVLNRRRGKGLIHPWLRDRASALPGKVWHSQAISLPQVFYNPLGRTGDAESIKPLASQPLIELCLRIPSYVHIDAGWSRSMARRAFHQDIPYRVIGRTTKGGGAAQIRSIVEQNISFVRDVLVDGHLVRQGLLDRAALVAALEGSPGGAGVRFSEIEDHLCTEVWVRRWLGESFVRETDTNSSLMAG